MTCPTMPLNSFASSEAAESRCSFSRWASAAATLVDHRYCTTAKAVSKPTSTQQTTTSARVPNDLLIYLHSSRIMTRQIHQREPILKKLLTGMVSAVSKLQPVIGLTAAKRGVTRILFQTSTTSQGVRPVHLELYSGHGNSSPITKNTGL